MSSKQINQETNPRDLKHSYNTLLNNAREHMTPIENTMSHIIHIGVVESTGELLSSAVARPTPLLLAPCFGLIAMLLSLFLSVVPDISTGNTLTLMAMATGYSIGLIIDLVKFVIKK